jgi:DNA-3-methyladenine glycosylase I
VTGVLPGPDDLPRCPWALAGLPDDRRYLDYHDDEWGRPLHGDIPLFERLCLEAFQSGLSWITVLRKRPAFRAAFAGFDPAAVAAFSEEDVDRLLADAGIIRNGAKVRAVIGNARALRDLQQSGRSLDELVWSHAPAVRRARPTDTSEVPATTPESIDLARELRAVGFRFVGPTTAYALMQACGLVDDHLAACVVGRL